MPKPIVIRISYGDLDYIGQGIVCAIRHRRWGCLRSVLWVIREHHRRGTWTPYTFGQHLALIRKRRARASDS